MAKMWSPRAASQIQFSLAPSTLSYYNSIVNRFHIFCSKHGAKFPPSSKDNYLIAEFLCELADSSDRPRSLLNSAQAAITWLYKAHFKKCPFGSDLSYLITALVKSGTKDSLRKSNVIPCEPINNMLRGLGLNSDMSIKHLRMKCIVLLAITFMLRPSDIAPKSVHFDPTNNQTKGTIFSTNEVEFGADGSLTLTFKGIKNDTDRAGFKTTIFPCSDSVLDPIECLQTYISRTEVVRPSDTSPVFLPLQAPFKALTAASIANILNDAIKLSGLDTKKYTAKSFRPTGATRAVSAGIDPTKARRIGRWKCESVFYEHYVHDKTPKNYTDSVLL